MSSLRSCAALVGLTLLAAACGSTVQQRGPASPLAEDSFGVGEAASRDAEFELPETARGGVRPSGPSGGPERATTVQGGPGSPTPSGTAGPRQVSQDSAGAAAPTPAGDVPGIEEGHVKLGFIVIRNSQGLGEATGFNISFGDQDGWVDAVVEHLNATGGVGGYPVKAVKYGLNAAGAQTFAQIQQEACEQFTNDDCVFAVLVSPRFHADNVLPNCLASRGVGMVTAGMSTTDEETLRARTWYLELADLNLTRQSRLLVDDMVGRGFFQTGALAPQLGLITYDCPNYRKAIEQGLRPALERHGLELAAEQAVSCSGDLQDWSAQMSSAVLRFRTEGVSHVIIVEGGGLLALLFMPAAESQAYRPLYALTSQSALHTLVVNVPREQLRGAQAIGWFPNLDQGPQGEVAPGQQRCEDLYLERGGYTREQLVFDALVFCDTALFTQAAARDIGHLTLDRLYQAAAQVPVQQSALTFGIRITADRKDGAFAYKSLAFDDEASRFVPTGERKPTD